MRHPPLLGNPIMLVVGVVVVVSSCVQTTSINGLHVNPIDTTTFRFGSMTIRGVAGSTHQQTIYDWCFPQYEKITDSAFTSVADQERIIEDIPSTFHGDSLIMRDHELSEWDSASWTFRFYLDSTRTAFKLVTWSFQTARWDGIFDVWEIRAIDTVFHVPFDNLSDGSLESHITMPSAVSYSYDSATRSDGAVCMHISTQFHSSENVAPSSLVTIRLRPQ